MTTRNDVDNARDEPDVDTLQRICRVCDAQPGAPCLDVGGDDGPGDVANAKSRQKAIQCFLCLVRLPS